METTDASAGGAGAADPFAPGVGNARARWAGFGRRFFAMCIDFLLIHLVLFPVFLLAARAWPDRVLVEPPLGWGTTTTLHSSAKYMVEHEDGTRSMQQRTVERVEAYGRRVYWRETTAEHAGGKALGRGGRKRWIVGPEDPTGKDWFEADDVVVWLWLLLCTLCEATRWQGSPGKRALGIVITDEHGARLGLLRALGRNALKILSALPMLIGFMMAGWTQRKQTLHDKIAGTLATRR